MKLRGRAYTYGRSWVLAPNVITCSPTWFAVGVQATVAMPGDPYPDLKAAPAGSLRLPISTSWGRLLAAASSSVKGWPR